MWTEIHCTNKRSSVSHYKHHNISGKIIRKKSLLPASIIFYIVIPLNAATFVDNIPVMRMLFKSILKYSKCPWKFVLILNLLELRDKRVIRNNIKWSETIMRGKKDCLLSALFHIYDSIWTSLKSLRSMKDQRHL